MQILMNTYGKTLLISLALVFVTDITCSNVRLENNGYKGVVVAIAPSVPESQLLVDEIKEMMTDASEDMYRATRNRAYFKEITILVPKTWTEGNYGLAADQTFEAADIRIDKPHPTIGHNPYAMTPGICGAQSQFYIHLTPDYVMDDKFINNYGPKGKVVVHEWGHYRWGVFDEYATSRNPAFYISERQTIEPTRCSANFAGRLLQVSGERCVNDTKTGLPSSTCYFWPYETQPTGMTSSFMGHQYEKSITSFCHSDPSDAINNHNTEAPNNHNKLCSMRSTWDVITNTVDFENGKNPENPNIPNRTPTISVVRAGIKRFVLVMDVSGSMNGKKLEDMRKAANSLISDFASDGMFIGLVEFSSTGRILKDLTKLSYIDDSRDELILALPDSAGGSTGIGSGILEGIDVLSADGSDAHGGVLVVLTDGEETEAPYVSSIASQVINKGVIVHSIFLGLSEVDAAAPLQDLSHDTGGKWFYASGAAFSSDLNEIFQTVSKSQDGDIIAQSVLIRSEVYAITNGKTRSYSLAIDNTVGNRTVLVFSWLEEHGSSPPRIELKTPLSNCYYSNYEATGRNYCTDNPIHTTDDAFKSIRFTIPGKAEVGIWEYEVTSEINDTISLTVTSSSSEPNIFPIIVESGTNSDEITTFGPAVIYATVQQGYATVLNANVTAVITSPVGTVKYLQLLDNGAGADGVKDDGLYSRFFVGFDSQGRYSIQVKAVGGSGDSMTGDLTAKSGLKLGYIAEDGSVIANPDALDESQTDNLGINISEVFERVTSGEGLAFSGTVPEGDKVPPNEITDLEVFQADLDNMSEGIILEFTAPGDDYDSGKAIRYEIAFTYGSPTVLREDFSAVQQINDSSLIEGSLHETKEALARERFVIFPYGLPEDAISVGITFAVRAFDDAKNPSESSNLAFVRFFTKPPQVSSSSRLILNSNVMVTFGLVSILALAELLPPLL